MVMIYMVTKQEQFLYQNYSFEQEQAMKAARKNAATHFLEFDKESREYKPVPIPQYARD